MAKTDRIPDESAWYDDEYDPDVQWMRDLFYGKSNAEVQEHFGGGRSIERANELLFAPRSVFQYYVHAFSDFVMSAQAKGDPDSASPFLGLLESREERDPGSVKEIFETLALCVDFIANNQTHFDADVDIYGDFRERAQRIREKCGA